MLIANFTNYGEEITVDGLWQYDYGQRCGRWFKWTGYGISA